MVEKKGLILAKCVEIGKYIVGMENICYVFLCLSHLNMRLKVKPCVIPFSGNQKSLFCINIQDNGCRSASPLYLYLHLPENEFMFYGISMFNSGALTPCK